MQCRPPPAQAVEAGLPFAARQAACQDQGAGLGYQHLWCMPGRCWPRGRARPPCSARRCAGRTHVRDHRAARAHLSDADRPAPQPAHTSPARAAATGQHRAVRGLATPVGYTCAPAPAPAPRRPRPQPGAPLLASSSVGQTRQSAAAACAARGGAAAAWCRPPRHRPALRDRPCGDRCWRERLRPAYRQTRGPGAKATAPGQSLDDGQNSKALRHQGCQVQAAVLVERAALQLQGGESAKRSSSALPRYTAALDEVLGPCKSGGTLASALVAMLAWGQCPAC